MSPLHTAVANRYWAHALAAGWLRLPAGGILLAGGAGRRWQGCPAPPLRRGGGRSTDTEMTTGYKLLLPAPMKDGTPCVVEVQVHNGTDFTRRSWDCAISATDTLPGISTSTSRTKMNGCRSSALTGPTHTPPWCSLPRRYFHGGSETNSIKFQQACQRWLAEIRSRSGN